MNTNDNTFNEFLRNIKKYRLLSPGESVLLLVSGGSDSMALLHLFYLLSKNFPLRLTVLHFNHGLRKDAAGDAELVERHCAELGIDFLLEKLPIKKYSKENKISIEEAGSLLRKAGSLRIASTIKADHIATGHTLDDQAETVLMRILRGAGTAGLSGIRIKSHPIFIRPLLSISRNDLSDFCRRNNIKYNEDITNKDISITRNLIRHETLPYLEKSNPGLKLSLFHTALLCTSDDSFLEDTAKKQFEKIAEKEKGAILIPADKISNLHDAVSSRIIKLAVFQLTGTLRDLSFSHIDQALSLIRSQSGKETVLPPSVKAVRKGGYLVLKKITSEKIPPPLPEKIDFPGESILPGWGIRFKSEIVDRPGKPDKYTVYLDAGKMKNLEIRAALPGDAFNPQGMAGKKKVKKFLMEKNIYEEERKKFPLLVSGDKVVWVIGFRIDRDFLPVSSAPVMRVEVEKLPGDEL
ncbi:MAG: tRNA lysidine(34) synthetase TilS [Chloroflexi bacterium]|nr:tRNA lysidine(34) synthetase TilS [Chloroflexota bacterium]